MPLAIADTIECVCCGSQWDGSNRLYCMSVGCPGCTPEAAQPEPEPSETAAAKALKRVFGRLHDTGKRQSSDIRRLQERLDALERHCQELERRLLAKE